MNHINLKTNLHCASCVSKLKPVLDGDARIHHWDIQLQSPEKPLHVHGNLSANDVVQLVAAAGYVASDLQPATVAACEMPATNRTATASAFSWSDGKVWKRASFNTLNCLIGCSIGDFGMIIFLQAFYPATSMLVQMVLAIIAGLITSVLLETSIMRFREKMAWALAFRTAIAMSFLSMVAMEFAMNATDFMITGGKMALSDPMYWFAFIPAAVAGFLLPLPYNYYQLKKHNKACH